MTKLKPILFSTPMVQAILEGRKTQTRRICKHQFWSFSERLDFNENKIHLKVDKNVSSPYQVGDILWVRETWNNWGNLHGCEPKYVYKATDLRSCGHNWRPSIFMPKEACRIFLKAINVRVERLNEISGADVVAEGVGEPFRSGARNMTSAQIDYNSWEDKQVTLFQSLWESINGAGSWEKNPYVWVYEFERIEKPEVWP
jgi:hypothetical protein